MSFSLMIEGDLDYRGERASYAGAQQDGAGPGSRKAHFVDRSAYRLPRDATAPFGRTTAGDQR
jgi:hypothetical protein